MLGYITGVESGGYHGALMLVSNGGAGAEGSTVSYTWWSTSWFVDACALENKDESKGEDGKEKHR